MHTVENFTRWTHTVANAILPASHPDHDDVVQEGLIAISACLADKGEEASATYLTTAAKRAMRAAAYDGKLTGQPDRRLRSGPPPQYADSLSQLAEDVPGYLEEQDALSVVEAGYAVVEWADLREQLDTALFDALSDRDADYVRRRFYLGQRDAEIALATDRTTKAVSNRWASAIRPALRAALADLAEVAA